MWIKKRKKMLKRGAALVLSLLLFLAPWGRAVAQEGPSRQQEESGSQAIEEPSLLEGALELRLDGRLNLRSFVGAPLRYALSFLNLFNLELHLQRDLQYFGVNLGALRLFHGFRQETREADYYYLSLLGKNVCAFPKGEALESEKKGPFLERGMEGENSKGEGEGQEEEPENSSEKRFLPARFLSVLGSVTAIEPAQGFDWVKEDRGAKVFYRLKVENREARLLLRALAQDIKRTGPSEELSIPQEGADPLVGEEAVDYLEGFLESFLLEEGVFLEGESAGDGGSWQEGYLTLHYLDKGGWSSRLYQGLKTCLEGNLIALMGDAEASEGEQQITLRFCREGTNLKGELLLPHSSEVKVLTLMFTYQQIEGESQGELSLGVTQKDTDTFLPILRLCREREKIGNERALFDNEVKYRLLLSDGETERLLFSTTLWDHLEEGRLSLQGSLRPGFWGFTGSHLEDPFEYSLELVQVPLWEGMLEGKRVLDMSALTFKGLPFQMLLESLKDGRDYVVDKGKKGALLLWKGMKTAGNAVARGAGNAANAVARGAGNAANAVAKGAGNAANAVAKGAGNAANALSRGVATAARKTTGVLISGRDRLHGFRLGLLG